MPVWDLAGRLVSAVLLGAVIGLERQWRQRGAGLRTNAPVATGASAFVVLSALMPGDSSPTRIAAQVVSGIGFLGAGVILREGLNVRGLNTAATLWCSGAVGTLAGSGFWLAAALTTAVVVLSNVALRPLGPYRATARKRHRARGGVPAERVLFGGSRASHSLAPPAGHHPGGPPAAIHSE
jgi:putative Mg2+ transporter-C (MgtC) family protein